jgi:hypothetical protein
MPLCLGLRSRTIAAIASRLRPVIFNVPTPIYRYSSVFLVSSCLHPMIFNAPTPIYRFSLYIVQTLFCVSTRLVQLKCCEALMRRRLGSSGSTSDFIHMLFCFVTSTFFFLNLIGCRCADALMQVEACLCVCVYVYVCVCVCVCVCADALVPVEACTL